jgi:cobalamin biosynthesis protein CobW
MRGQKIQRGILSMTHKIPATVVTGFLGVGKTTLIRHLLANNQGRKLALIINEFGEIGVDGDILKACGNESCTEEDIIELANGCICCTVADDFIPTMTQVLAREPRPDHIIIETSGLALPQPLIRAFNWPEISAQVSVDGVITVVDGKAIAEGRFTSDPAALERQRREDPNLDHENPIEELFEDQLNAADMVIINKSDLMSVDELESVTAQLKSKARGATKFMTTSEGQADPRIWLGLESNAENDLHNRLSHHEMEGEEQHDHDDFVSFSVSLGMQPSQDAVFTAVQNLVETTDILRVKGFANISGSNARLLIQAVGPRVAAYFDRPWRKDEMRRTELVVIAEKHIDRTEIEQTLRQNLAA